MSFKGWVWEFQRNALEKAIIKNANRLLALTNAQRVRLGCELGTVVIKVRDVQFEDEKTPCDVCEGWHCWHGGDDPVAPEQPVRVWWKNKIQRTYDRGEYVVWKNLPTDGSVRWKLP